MKPRRTPTSTTVFELSGGNEDNSLWARVDSSVPEIETVWELSETERCAIAGGATIELRILGTGHPPVHLGVGPSMEERRR
ncbi:MAG TPA: hypothetical protein VG265_07280 [Gaiellaceae bacterium]|jgi:hypothetical protein|nr:hypothetical protein [Gaiellaceae bacterium]